MKATVLAGCLFVAPSLALAQAAGGSTGNTWSAGPGGAGEMGKEYAPHAQEKATAGPAPEQSIPGNGGTTFRSGPGGAGEMGHEFAPRTEEKATAGPAPKQAIPGNGGTTFRSGPGGAGEMGHEFAPSPNGAGGGQSGN